MKVVIVNGGPTRGCETDELLRHFIVKMKARGIPGHQHVLCELERLESCRSCGCCMDDTASRCVIKDDLAPVLADLVDAEIVVLGIPFAGKEPSACFKTFFTRFYSFLRADGSSRLPPGKKAFLVLTPENPICDIEKMLGIYTTNMGSFGFSELHYVALTPSTEPELIPVFLQAAKNDTEVVLKRLLG
jgi:multimeric flavodoxin WrbA